MWEWLVELVASLKMFVTILPGHRGVLCRFGRFKKVYEPSMQFIIPFIDHMEVLCVAEQVEDLRAQSITTKDRKAILVSGKLRYRVSQPELALFEVYDWDDALADEALGVLAEECMKRTFEECLDHISLANEIEKAVRRVAKKWGIEISGFTFTDMVIHRAIRLEWNNTLLGGD